jgi:hypothetical protein
VLGEGEVLVAETGTYDPDVNGLPIIDCTGATCGGGACNNGSAENPIHVVADQPGKAFLKSNESWTEPALSIRECSYWQVSGLHASGADVVDGAHAVIEVRASSFIELDDLFVNDSNREESSQLVLIRDSDEVVVDGLEAYRFHADALRAENSSNLHVRNSYFNGEDYADLPGGHESDSDCPDRGDIAVSYRGTINSHVDSSLVEAVCDGIEIAPASNGNQGSIGAHLTNLLVRDARESGVHLESKCDNACDPLDAGCSYEAACPTKWDVVDTEVDNVLVVSADKGFELEGPVGATLSHVTSIAHQGEGIHLRLGDPTNDVLALSAAVDHSLVIDGHNGITVDSNTGIDTLLDWLRVFGNDTNLDYDPATTKVNEQDLIEQSVPTSACFAYFPPESTLATDDGGEGTGADIRYLSVDGVQSEAPMWNANDGSFECHPILGDDFQYGAERCDNAHERFRIASGGCAAPSY